ncbi:hypothetical protein GARC_4402 [Paraglaciecola arctica BSs20135]|uniref:Uncharacterized protein n=1 Tax=Paraglaciecola arctica BSs20135 TaxID=493475 RepID=K6XL36_9ALTE|nr:hypothetical protein GARC_4402 [Paraglaciecola arctica BSs20135]
MTGDKREDVTDCFLSFAVTQGLIIEYWQYAQSSQSDWALTK